MKKVRITPNSNREPESANQVSFPTSTAEPTKRGILGKVAKICDPLGLASPVTLSGKMLYRDTCDTKISWDSPLPSALQAKWKKWEQGLPEHVNAPRNVMKHEELINRLIHIRRRKRERSFSRGSCSSGVTIRHESRSCDNKVAAREERTHNSPFRTSGHMAANLVQNVKEVLKGFPRKKLLWLAGQHNSTALDP